jgi:hypothetical protein
MEGIEGKKIYWKGQGLFKNEAQKHKKFRGECVACSLLQLSCSLLYTNLLVCGLNTSMMHFVMRRNQRTCKPSAAKKRLKTLPFNAGDDAKSRGVAAMICVSGKAS